MNNSNQINSTWHDRIIADCTFVDFQQTGPVLTAMLDTPVQITKLPIGYELTRGEHIVHCLEEPDVVVEIKTFVEIEDQDATTVRGLLDILTTLGLHDVVEQFENQDLWELDQNDHEARHSISDAMVQDILANTNVGNHYSAALEGAYYA